ncbi:YrhB domain-containing protein [Chitinophaga japonensis]|uniref:Immunity protein 35 of polymorphic toxin system n=1 Tax=Chitinophaga japonensis TaxID=104662 RepID=A0A562SYB2_CHIJA|nr:YrhB domain-containing protein [Chitinophaga japonensis]TWI86345.1 immunity protein 35 of polymorphic toxin system [Chitinophaga japonensis]
MSMITLDDAINIAREYLHSVRVTPPLELELLLDDVIEFEYGWVFFYQSKEYLKTGDILDALGGNAPIIVNKFDGSLHITGTAHPVEKYISDYVKDLKK